MTIPPRFPLVVGAVTCLAVVWLSLTVFADTRWWTLALAAFLLAGGLVVARRR